MANDKLITASVIGINGNPVSATTFGFPANQMLVEAVTLSAPFATAVNKITELRSNTVYYTTTTTTAMITSDGTANNLIHQSASVGLNVIGKNGVAYPSAVNTLFPAMGITVQVVSFPATLPSGADNPLASAVSEITVLATGDVYYTAQTTANIISYSGTA
jgi:hypothetical protein